MIETLDKTPNGTLHLFNQGPDNVSCMNRCLQNFADGDTLLLIENGVYWALPVYANQLTQVGGHLLTLAPDVDARGLTLSSESIDDDQFVGLCTTHHNVVSWF